MEEPKKTEEEKKNDDNKIGCFEMVIIIVILCSILSSISRSCESSSYDSTWNHLQHQVDNDPYYRQWD